MMRWSMNMEQLVGWEPTGETEVLGENLPHSHSVHCRSHITWPGIKPRPPWWEDGDWLPELWHDPQVFIFISSWFLEVWEKGQGELYIRSDQADITCHIRVSYATTCMHSFSKQIITVLCNNQYELKHEMYKQWSNFITRECLSHKCHLFCIQKCSEIKNKEKFWMCVSKHTLDTGSTVMFNM
jgi:hypothetical protein